MQPMAVMRGGSRSEPRKDFLPRAVGFRTLAGLWLALFLGTALSGKAAPPQFDVFLGYDGIVPEASWFPILCEIKNDGPPFIGVVEVEAGQYNQGQTRGLGVELPTGTLKPVVIPGFSTTPGLSSWDVRLLDQRGKGEDEASTLR